MKKIIVILMLLLIPFLLQATRTTYQTISIDGTNDFDTDSEKFSVTTGNGQIGNVWVTWNATTIYVGFSGNSGNGDCAADNRAMFIYVDNDPQLTPTDGTGTINRGDWSGITGTLPFTANYRFVYQTTQTGGSGHNWLDYYWSDSNWTEGSIADNSAESNDDFVEIAILRSDIGSPSQIYLCAYIQEQWDGGWVGTGIPSDLFSDFTDDNLVHNFNNHWLGFILTSGVTPNALGNQDQTLPVELSTFTAQYLNSKPTLYWTTQSETDNMGWFVYRNKIEDFTSATKVSGMIEGHGTTTQAQSYIYEDVIANPQVDDVYYYWLESVDYSGTIHHFDKVAMITIPETNDPNQNVTPPQVYDLLASPNPFNETTNIEFMLTQTAMVDVAIYDVKGGLVKSFDTQHVTAEVPVSLQWDGKDENGKSLSNGIYLYSLKVNGQDYATKQVILMK